MLSFETMFLQDEGLNIMMRIESSLLLYLIYCYTVSFNDLFSSPNVDWASAKVSKVFFSAVKQKFRKANTFDLRVVGMKDPETYKIIYD
jgi:hypothetical protein